MAWVNTPWQRATSMAERSLFLCVVLLLGGCECGSSGSTGAGSAGGTETEGEATGLPMGTIEGVIRLAEGSDTPAYAVNPVEGSGPSALPPECSPARTTDREPLRVSPDRGLSFVPVVGMGDAAHWPERGAPRSIDVHIRDCRLDPPVVTATSGDVLRVHNELVYPFFPALGTGAFMQAVLPGEAREFELDSPRPVTLQCTMTAHCGRTEVLVLGSPVHTVSGEGGHFTLEVPADQDVELVAWHPLVVESSVHVTVGAGETAHVEIVVTAAPQAAPEEESLVPEGERPEDHPELGPF